MHTKLARLPVCVQCVCTKTHRLSRREVKRKIRAGQGVVAFAQGARDDLAYALKFFVHRPSFLAERDTYRSRALGVLLPKVYCEYDPEESPGMLTDGAGRPLPACLVMERGEGLADWSRRARPDIFQSVAVRGTPYLCHSLGVLS